MDDNPDTAEESEGLSRRDEENPEPEPITHKRIAERAHLISQSDQAGTDEQNWLRAEQELREEQDG
jgi:hypothetical protein